jgi:NADPH-dependent curcumin reductase
LTRALLTRALLTRALLTKRIKIQGFIIFDYYGPPHSEFLGPMSA